MKQASGKTFCFLMFRINLEYCLFSADKIWLLTSVTRFTDITGSTGLSEEQWDGRQHCMSC